MPNSPVLADAPANVVVSAPQSLAGGFRHYERYRVEVTSSGGAPRAQVRDVLRVGRVIGVLALDRAREEIVLLRQFRLPAHLATGQGELVEIVAGHVEAGEDLVEAARRECVEEIGVAPQALYELFSFLPAPGHVLEYTTLYLALVDAAQVPALAGAVSESEETHPMRIKVVDALAALDADTMRNGYLLLALQWLARHWTQLDQWLAEKTPV